VGLDAVAVFKVNEGRPNIADKIRLGEISLVINTPLGRASHYDERAIRRASLQFNVPCVTTMTGAQAVVEAIASRKDTAVFQVYSLQELHEVAQAAG
jgi:carbamoyl-phosphate synthase large subunit